MAWWIVAHQINNSDIRLSEFYESVEIIGAEEVEHILCRKGR